MSQEHDAIAAAVQAYLDGLYEGDADKLSDVFHPMSTLTCEEDGVMKPVPRDRWLEKLRGRTSAQARALPRYDDVLQIDQASKTMAFVKLKYAIPPRYVTDYLCFLKVGGKWQIVQRVFTTEIYS